MQVSCDSGKVAIGGGFYRSHQDIEISHSYAINNATWQVQAYNTHPAQDSPNLVVHVICVNG
ncbi:MAG: hypothetical protein M3285_11570 [Actinomycetota bacterium]|nr:hypothetical protein [Actinomycetota bacterium]